MRAITLQDGSILSGFATQDSTNVNRIMQTAQSTDGGVTWTDLGIVDQGPLAQRELNNAFPLLLPNGRLLFAFRNHDYDSSGQITYYRITLTYSDDGGNTWTYLAQIDERAANTDAGSNNGLWEPFLRVSANGTLQAFYSSENSAADQDNIMKISFDNGSTWSDEIPVSGQGITARDGMTGVANVDDNGNLMYVLSFFSFFLYYLLSGLHGLLGSIMPLPIKEAEDRLT